VIDKTKLHNLVRGVLDGKLENECLKTISFMTFDGMHQSHFHAVGVELGGTLVTQIGRDLRDRQRNQHDK
jgi:hypothetical protein